MIYTIGHRQNYLDKMVYATINGFGLIHKSQGGYAFGTPEEAQAEMERLGKQDVWAVWEVDGDMMKHVTVDTSERFFVLTEDRPILAEYKSPVNSS